ncbi:MAG: DUF4166 domain-containing protein [Methylibium sp.]|nr:DUF4166 domain-containing protein [Methylibium sp.]
MSPPTLYERALGPDAYARLPLAVQRFHRLGGLHVFAGQVRTCAPQSRISRLLARCLGTPRQDSQGRLHFELQSSPDSEQWTRRFPAQTMRSKLTLEQSLIVERLGAASLRFRLCASEHSLTMELDSLSFLGIPCPRWLLPQVFAEESGQADALHFKVRAALPVLGEVAHYEGYLDLDRERAR